MQLQVTQQVAKSQYDAKVIPTTLIPKQVGNMYTASLYAALASLIHNKHNSLVHALIFKVCLFICVLNNSLLNISFLITLRKPNE